MIDSASRLTASARKDLLLDVSRLIWRSWRGKLPTGIDRVCREYVAYFGPRSLAVIQYAGRTFVLDPAASDRLFSLLLDDRPGVRKQMFGLGIRAIAAARPSPPKKGMIYLNVGHTGLNRPALMDWISRSEVRAVHLIHDVIPIAHPQFCRPGEARKHSDRMRHALESATGIIGNSQDTLDELAKFAASVQLAMPPSVAAWISGVRISRPVIPRSLGRPHFVAIGTIEGRKNHVLLLDVWRRLIARLGHQAPALFLIGQRGWEAEEAIAILDGEEGLAGHVRELGRCEDRDLLELLAGATALLMPSFAEGFGLPIIEALQVGTPVIASDLPVFRELAGDIPEYLDPSDAEAWEAAIKSFMAKGAEYQRQKSSMNGYLAPTWHEHFAIVEDWLSTLPAGNAVRSPMQQSGNFDRD